MKKIIIPIVILIVVVASAFLVLSKRGSSQPTVPTSQTVQAPVDTNTTYTMNDVAQHNSQSDCWTVIDNNVYNITNFIDIHPGGREIIRACGIDASGLFASVRDHGSEAVQTLPTYKIGVLKTN
ncbi:MAG TPA: cytochrome b5-like heme/steroid binding domain-containing protein [Patescibacteria group bacterium]|nr:cytochrome b5-like heme/steroid binding domain-containing protein [Patescibacteria group bacterium]